jgi:hypothetical protein
MNLYDLTWDPGIDNKQAWILFVECYGIRLLYGTRYNHDSKPGAYCVWITSVIICTSYEEYLDQQSCIWIVRLLQS